MNRPTDVRESAPPLTARQASRRDFLSAAVGGTALAALPAAAQTGSEPPAITSEMWQWVRMQPVIEPRIAYLDSATLGPTWRSAMATEYRSREAASLGSANFANEERWAQESTRLAERFGGFVGCDADEVLFTRGAGEALGLVAAGLDLAEGDEVITTTHEHPAAIAPWQALARRRGLTIKMLNLGNPVPAPEEALGRLAGAVTDRTRVLLFSHVHYTDGALIPIADLCQFARERDILSVVDGAQALGMLQVDVRELDCDFYATCFHKWLSGTHGTGMLYVRRERLDGLWPQQPRTESWQLGLPAALQKLGSIVPYAWPALRGAEVAVDLHTKVNRARIEARIRELTLYARLRLEQFATLQLITPPAPGHWAGILTARLANHSASDVATTLLRVHRVRVGVVTLPGSGDKALRIAFNIFNSHDDIEQLIKALRVVVGS